MSITLYPRPFDFRGDILKIETVKYSADGYFTAAGLKMNKANHNGKTMRIFSFDIR